MNKFSVFFSRFSRWASHEMGTSRTFVIAVLVVLVWAISGPIFHFSDAWQLTINTGTTIVTFLMVFLIQNTQNRDSDALHIKLDELIRSMQGAHNALLDLEELTQDDLEKIRSKYVKLASAAREALRSGKIDTSNEDVD